MPEGCVKAIYVCGEWPKKRSCWTPGTNLLWLEHRALGRERRERTLGCVRNDHLSSRGFEFNGETGLVDIDPQSQISRVCQGLHESGWHLGLLGTAAKSNYSNFFLI